MASEEEKYKGFRPYFEKPNDWDAVDPDLAPVKEITLMPSTIETIDLAVHNWIKEEVNK